MTNWPLPQGSTVVRNVGAMVALPVSNNQNIKSAWVELVAATAQDLDAITFQVQHGRNANANYYFDIAIGPAGDEAIVLRNMFVRMQTPYVGFVELPLSIPAGSRVSARVQSAAGSSHTAYVSAFGVGGNTRFGSGHAIIANLTFPTGEAVPGGAAPANGRLDGIWVPLVEANVNDFDCRGFYVTWADAGDASRFLQEFDLEVGLGPEGQEVTVFDLVLRSYTGAWQQPFILGPIYAPIRRDQRVAMRAIGSADQVDQISFSILGLVE